MTPLRIQRLLAFVFLSLGGWALFFPAMVEALVFVPEHQVNNATSALLIGCFGAQACLCGIVIGLSRFRAVTFLVFGIAGSAPFFAFNYYFMFVSPMFTNWLLLDFVGNVTILGLCLLGYRQMKHLGLRTT